MSNIQKFTVQATPETVRFFGRTAEGILPDAVFFNWTCSGFAFRFTGIDAKAELMTDIRQEERIACPEERAYIAVFVDDMRTPVREFPLDRERGWYTLAENLPDGEHTVKVVKLTEMGYGRAAVSQISVIGTSEPVPIVPKARRIEFIGDSITCGYGNTCTTGSCEFVTGEENGFRAYASQIALALEAEYNCVCASGNGVWHDYGMNQVHLMPELYRYTDKLASGHYGKSAQPWETAKFVPELVVIKLGANDAQYVKGMDKPETERTEELIAERKKAFTGVYYSFLEQVRQANPDAKILCIYDSDTFLKDEVTSAVLKFAKEKPDARIFIKGVPSKNVELEGVGANGHWSVKTHEKVAGLLVPYIKAIMNW